MREIAQWIVVQYRCAHGRKQVRTRNANRAIGIERRCVRAQKRPGVYTVVMAIYRLVHLRSMKVNIVVAIRVHVRRIPQQRRPLRTQMPAGDQQSIRERAKNERQKHM